MEWGRCLWASISMVSSGLSEVCCGSGRSLGMGGGGRFSVVFGVVDVTAICDFGWLDSAA